MKRYANYLFTTCLGCLLIFLALSNRSSSPVYLLPPELNYFANDMAINLPIFLIFFSGLLLGVIIGFFWEWLRGHSQRARASKNIRELKKANAKIQELKNQKYQGSDELVSILDDMK